MAGMGGGTSTPNSSGCAISCTNGCSGNCRDRCDDGCKKSAMQDVYERLKRLSPEQSQEYGLSDFVLGDEVIDLKKLILNEFERRGSRNTTLTPDPSILLKYVPVGTPYYATPDLSSQVTITGDIDNNYAYVKLYDTKISEVGVQNVSSICKVDVYVSAPTNKSSCKIQYKNVFNGESSFTKVLTGEGTYSFYAIGNSSIEFIKHTPQSGDWYEAKITVNQPQVCDEPMKVLDATSHFATLQAGVDPSQQTVYKWKKYKITISNDTNTLPVEKPTYYWWTFNHYQYGTGQQGASIVDKDTNEPIPICIFSADENQFPNGGVTYASFGPTYYTTLDVKRTYGQFSEYELEHNAKDYSQQYGYFYTGQLVKDTQHGETKYYIVAYNNFSPTSPWYTLESPIPLNVGTSSSAAVKWRKLQPYLVEYKQYEQVTQNSGDYYVCSAQLVGDVTSTINNAYQVLPQETVYTLQDNVFTISKQDWDLYTSESTYDGYLYVYDGSSEEQAQSSDRYYTDSKYVFGEKGTIINNDGYEILNPTANAINKNLYNIIVNLQDKNDSPKVETNKIIASNSNYKDDLIRKSDIKIYVSKAFDLYEQSLANYGKNDFIPSSSSTIYQECTRCWPYSIWVNIINSYFQPYSKGFNFSTSLVAWYKENNIGAEQKNWIIQGTSPQEYLVYMGTEKDMQNILKTRYNTDANFSITREFSILDEEVEELKRKGFYNQRIVINKNYYATVSDFIYNQTVASQEWAVDFSSPNSKFSNYSEVFVYSSQGTQINPLSSSRNGNVHIYTFSKAYSGTMYLFKYYPDYYYKNDENKQRQVVERFLGNLN